ncbi:glycoside hydrolase family 20 protein [Polaribacter sp.]|uniref:beta-N-acetylhexosaminidase n=1 Tax=Polaribacter sp. TaxID=1920175 RepID=UPI0025EDB254|nr:glycoside hydrolase family 20 protein [Polaribacter sp.]
MFKKLAIFSFIFYTISSFSQKQIKTIPAVQNWTYASQNIDFNNVTVNWSSEINAKQKNFLERFKSELKSIGVKYVDKKKRNTLEIAFEKVALQSGEKQDTYKINIGQTTKVTYTSFNSLVYASRTLLQLLVQEAHQKSLPKGEIVDYPEYGKRMLMIDVGRKFFTVQQIKDFIKIMAWVKMNELHLHLSDNGWGGYSAYRLESKLHPELTAKDGHYSWEEIRDLQGFAHSYGITITPEIDSPGHSLAFTKIRPDLRADWLSENYLDIKNKDTYPFMEGILAEVIPHFDAPDLHLGTDEYRLSRIKNDSIKEDIGNTFRKYINHFNKVVKKNGKVTRIWSGFENMPGDTKIDKDIIIDMWETSDAKNKSDRGYQFINSSHYFTYVVPGAKYYGVNNKFIYEKWTPEIFGRKEGQNLTKGSPGLLGSKMHIWNDYGPTGYSISEIARISVPSILTFSEKMWGTKAYSTYDEFSKNIPLLIKVPDTQVLNRDYKEKETIVYKNKNIDLTKTKDLPINVTKSNIEYPWSLKLTLLRTKESTGKELLLTSSLASVYSDLEHKYKKKRRQKKATVKRGFAIVRANQTPHDSPITSHGPQVIVFDYKVPLNKKVKIKLIGEKGKTSMYVDGKLIGSEKLQMLCPLESLGSTLPETEAFHGTIKNICVKELK